MHATGNFVDNRVDREVMERPTERFKNADDMSLSVGARVGLVRAIGFAGQRRISQLPFGNVVGRFDFRVENKHEQLLRDH